MKIFVSVVDSAGKKSTFALRTKPIIVGRSSKAHVSISDDLASSMHCLIYIKDNAVFVEDNKSKNGILLNGVKVYKQRIYLEDKVKIGNSFLFFDLNRLDDDVKALLTPKDSGNKIARDMTLELETAPREFQTRTIIRDKLFEGVQQSNTKEKPETGFNKKTLVIRENIATFIDFILAVSSLVIPGYVFYSIDPAKFKTLFLSKDILKIEIETLTSQPFLILLGSSLVFAFIFHKINRGKLKMSIGEICMGLR